MTAIENGLAELLRTTSAPTLERPSRQLFSFVEIALSLRSDGVAISCIPVPRSTATRKTAAAVGSTSDRIRLIPHPVAHALSEELPELRIELAEPRLKDGVACDRFTPHLQERFGYGSALREFSR